MDPLTARAERALLGAMIADPALTGRLRISPHEFASERHAAVYASIRAARQAPSAGSPGGWQGAILRAGPSLTAADLDDLVRACPFVPHGPAYAVMVIQAWARRHLDQSAHILAIRSTLLELDAQQVMPWNEPAGQQMTATARHLQRVAFAIREHAWDFGPYAPGPSSGPLHGASPGRVRREEAVLSGLLRHDPERNPGILRVLPAEAFANLHRREIYQVLTAMHQAGKAVDELTLDWELATQGLPLGGRKSGGAARDGLTYAMQLARLNGGHEEPATAARELAAEYERSRSEPPVGSGRRGKPDTGATTRSRGDAPAAKIPRRLGLRLVQPPPEAGGPTERGPQQAR